MNEDGTNDVSLRVRKIIAESLCVELNQVTPDANLMRDLGAESIDFLDIMFRLEKDFSIKIQQREIERQARGGISAEDFEADSILQPQGLARLREILPEIKPSEFRDGMSLRELPSLFTVAVFINIVERKIGGTLFQSPAAHPLAETPTPSAGV